jgi:diguanylate cyclase (GGDEF)-like protein
VREGETGAAVLLIDLNGFKEINDTWGHAVGDEVLVITAKRLGRRIACETTMTLARLGGDEFAVLIEDIDEQQAVTLAADLAAAADEPIDASGERLRCGMSVGVAYVRAGDRRTTGSGLLRDADMAMYQTKRASRLSTR